MGSAITEIAHLQIPLQKIQDATNNFSDNNIIGEGGFGKVYRGILEHDEKIIKIAARRLDSEYGHGDVEFWREVSTLSYFSGNNYIVAMIGFCDEKGEKIIVTKHYPKGSLSMYISNPLILDVERIFEIAQLVCSGIREIHSNMGGYYIIHRNINSSTILLDRRWQAKLSGFEFSIIHSKERRNQVEISEAIGIQGYIDPAIEKYGGVSHKSDIYSIGVVLFEMLCGRKAFEANTLLAPFAKFHYENGTLEDIIRPDIWNQMKPKAFKCFSKLAYSCLEEDPALRPEADELWMQLLEATLLQEEQNEMQQEKHPIFKNVLERSSPDLDLWKVNKWEHLRIGLICIHSPILYILDCFNKQEIEYYNIEYVSFIEQKKTNKLPKIRKTVTTKVVKYKEDVFLREIEILDSCKHPNIQSFLGFHDNGNTMMLFYEHVSNKYLYHSLGDVNLKWEKRLKICIDVAHGLDYLHNGMEDQKMVIHGDLNSLKIELDDNLGAMIIGFENSVILHSNQNDDSIQLNKFIWNKDYLDPEYFKTRKPTRESDVFSFGVVMFEILCGRVCSDITCNERKTNEDMTSFARRWFDEGTIKKKLATGIKEETISF